MRQIPATDSPSDGIKNAFVKQSKPAVQLVRTDRVTKSKIGGKPNAQKGFEWPTWNTKPLEFIAQLDLEEFASHQFTTGLPTDGALYFFYDQAQSTWGFDPKDRGSWQVIYERMSIPVHELAPPKGKEETCFDSIYVAAKPISTYPSVDRLELQLAGDQQDAVFDIVNELKSEVFDWQAEHQLGGYPDPIQSDEMEFECQLVTHGLYCGNASGYNDPRAAELKAGASEWQLLLQIDSDEDAGMMWGDSGRLYFWIKKSDLARQHFADVWMILQCG